MDLEGGNHGYLALVLTDIEYASIPNTELFIPPIYLLPLIIPAIVIPIQALELKDSHNKQKRVYLEYKNMEKHYYIIYKKPSRINISNLLLMNIQIFCIMTF